MVEGNRDGWTIDTLKSYIDSKFDTVNTTVEKTASDADRRFDGVDEFRLAWSDESSEFVRSSEYHTSHALLTDRLSEVSNQISSIETAVKSTTVQAVSGRSLFISGASVTAVVLIAIVTGAIQLGNLQTRVLIDTEAVTKLQSDETARIVEHASENVQRGNIETKQGMTEHRVQQIEDDFRQKQPDINALIERIAKLEIEIKNGMPNK